jgi:hypothetical protein
VTEVPIRITGRGLPGLRCGDHSQVHVGVQRGSEVTGLVPGDAAEAVFDLTVTLATTADGPRFRGPYVHGRAGERFLYLSWGELHDGEFTMFRRAKLHLPDPADGPAGLDAELVLTDARGGPLCASVRPPVITWRPR